jgi:hypothetical protein
MKILKTWLNFKNGKRLKHLKERNKKMNVYGEFNRMAKSHVADITECEVLTDEIIKSARTFIGNAIKWDSGAYRPVVDALHKRLLGEIL